MSFINDHTSTVFHAVGIWCIMPPAHQNNRHPRIEVEIHAALQRLDVFALTHLPISDDVISERLVHSYAPGVLGLTTGGLRPPSLPRTAVRHYPARNRRVDTASCVPTSPANISSAPLPMSACGCRARFRGSNLSRTDQTPQPCRQLGQHNRQREADQCSEQDIAAEDMNHVGIASGFATDFRHAQQSFGGDDEP